MLLHVHEMAYSRLLPVSLWRLPISALLQSPVFCIFNLAKINQPFLTLSLLLKLYLELWGLKPSDAASDEINIFLSFMASNVLIFPHPSLLTVNSNRCFIISFFFFTFNFVITIPYLPSLFFFFPKLYFCSFWAQLCMFCSYVALPHRCCVNEAGLQHVHKQKHSQKGF